MRKLPVFLNRPLQPGEYDIFDIVFRDPRPKVLPLFNMKRRKIPLFITQENFPMAIDFTSPGYAPLSPGRRRRMLANDQRGYPTYRTICSLRWMHHLNSRRFSGGYVAEISRDR
jgi:hypothetical protein